MVSIRVEVSQGASLEVRAMANAAPELAVAIARRAALAARTAVISEIRKVFTQGARRSGGRFDRTIPKIRRDPFNFGGGSFGFEVETRPVYRIRRKSPFDLFWLFAGAPRTVRSGKGRWLALPIGPRGGQPPEAQLPSRGAGRASAIAWPQDLKGRGWTLWTLPPKLTGKRYPILMGAPPGQPRSKGRPLFVLVPQIQIRKRLSLEAIAKRITARLPSFEAAEIKRLEGLSKRSRRGRR
jgi:hypothetical protein